MVSWSEITCNQPRFDLDDKCNSYVFHTSLIYSTRLIVIDNEVKKMFHDFVFFYSILLYKYQKCDEWTTDVMFFVQDQVIDLQPIQSNIRA